MAGFGKSGNRDASKFTGMVGRESKSKTGHQGIHHHPLEIELGNGVTGGMKPGGITAPVMPPGPKGAPRK